MDVDEEEDDEISDEEETTPASVPRATSLEVIYILKLLNSCRSKSNRSWFRCRSRSRSSSSS